MKDFIFPNTGWEYHKRKRDSGKGAGNTDRCWKKKIENKMISFPSKKKATDFLSAFEKCGDEVKAIISVKGYGNKFVKKVQKNAAKKTTKTKRKYVRKNVNYKEEVLSELKKISSKLKKWRKTWTFTRINWTRSSERNAICQFMRR